MGEEGFVDERLADGGFDEKDVSCWEDDFFVARGWRVVDEILRDILDGVLQFISTSTSVVASCVGGSFVFREVGV